MDYLFFLTLCHTSLATLNISYDIVYQWHKKLWQHMSGFPLSIYFNFVWKAISFFIPKFHFPAHIKRCQTMFLFNFKCGVGWMDGEAPECGWANINTVTSSTKEMGPSARCDMLDDFFGHWNWKKVVGLGVYICFINQQAALNDWEEGLKDEYRNVLNQWRLQVEAWKDD